MCLLRWVQGWGCEGDSGLSPEMLVSEIIGLEIMAGLRLLLFPGFGFSFQGSVS